MQVPPISWLPLRMVTFIGAQFRRTLSCFNETAPRVIQPLYAVPVIVAALIAPFCVQKHRREIYGFLEILRYCGASSNSIASLLCLADRSGPFCRHIFT